MATQSARPGTASPLDAHRSPVAGSDTRSGKATASMIVGIVGLIGALLVPLLGWILGTVAVVLGSVARSDVKRKGCQGRAQATAGWVLGIIALVVATILFVFVLSHTK